MSGSDAGPAPIVYLGPSAPAEEIRRILPQAVIRPPASRGALYRDRLLRFSVFLLIDGVFAQEEALSPREVVDVLEDGARVVGAASMGALRAADCAPAGMGGIGTVYRLFRTGALSSEDEVAVGYIPEAPFPAVTDALVNIRIALRHAARAGAVSREEALRVVDAAAALHYADRTWTRAAEGAGLADRGAALRKVARDADAKRADAVRAAHWLAARLAADPGWGCRPRRRPHVFGLSSEGRERQADALRGRDEDVCAPGFVTWFLASGRGAPFLDKGRSCLDLLSAIYLDSSRESGGSSAALSDNAADTALVRLVYAQLSGSLRRVDRFHAEWFRYDAFVWADGVVGAGRVSVEEERMAGSEIAARQGVERWDEVVARAGSAGSALARARRMQARGRAAKRLRVEGR